MAVQVKRVIRMSANDQVTLEVFMEYHDDDFRVVNDDGEPDDFRVVRWYGTNHSAVPRTIEVQKGNGQNYASFTLAAGESFSQNAGGPVKYEFDVPRWRYA